MARALGMLATLGLFAAVLYRGVAWTNFGGSDEWLILEINNRGLSSMPHSNRPLNCLWSLPAAWLTPWRFEGYRVVYLAYLALSGWATWLLVRRLEPAAPLLALSAGTFVIAWAPLDMARLAVVQMVPNAAVTFLGVLAIAFLADYWRAGRWAVLLAGLLVATLAARSYEGVLGLLAGAPMVLVLLPRPALARRRLVGVAVWEAAVAVLTAAAALPLLRRDGAVSYQSEVLHAEALVSRYFSRLMAQYVDHLAPLFSPTAVALAATDALLPLGAFALALLISRTTEDPRNSAAVPSPRRLASLAVLGLVLAGCGYSILLLGSGVTGATRMQFLSAPGIAVSLAAVAALSSSLVRGRLRPFAHIGLSAAVLAIGAGHLSGMQATWHRISRYEDQRSSLLAMVAVAPALRPGTLLLLIDDDGTWPHTMTFRHATRLVYGWGVTGHVLNADPFLYSAIAGRAGVQVEPSPVIARGWREPATTHRYDEVLVLNLRAGRVSSLPAWSHPWLPALPPGAVYRPDSRIQSAPPPPSRRVLE